MAIHDMEGFLTKLRKDLDAQMTRPTVDYSGSIDGSTALTGLVSPTWTAGLAPVQLDPGQPASGTVYALVGRGLSVFPGDRVVVQPVGSTYFIVTAGLPTPVFPNQIPLIGLMSSVWANYMDSLSGASDANSYSRATVSRTSAGFVALSGAIVNVSGATVAAGTTLLTLPAPFRPLQRKRLVVYTTAAQVGIIVETTGVVTLEQAIGASVVVSLNRLKWTNDPNIVWTQPVLAAPFSNFGGTDGVARYGLDSVGRVFSEGLIKGGTAVAQSIYTLPTALNNSLGQLFSSYELSASNRFSRVDSGTSVTGIPTMQPPATNTGRSLDLDWVPTGAGSPAVTAIPFTAGANYTSGPGWSTFGYVKFPDGSVKLKGLVVPTATGSIIGYLPSGCRPAARTMWAVDATDVTGRVDISANGAITFVSGTATFVSLEDIAFIPEQ
jgi:hypothetical protein